MTSKSRTIDNLGIDASIRYARDKELFEPRFIDESQIVSRKSEIAVSKPYIPSEFDQVFSSRETAGWACFNSPSSYGVFEQSLFSYQLLPSLGKVYEESEDLDPLTAIENILDKEKEGSQNKSGKEKQEEEKEKRILAELLGCIVKIDKTLTLINSRRNQYQRG